MAVANESNSKKIITICEKKIASKLANSKTITKLILDDDFNKILDQSLIIMANEIGQKEADKRIRAIVKSSFKIGIMIHNNEFSESQLQQMREFRSKFKNIALTILSFNEMDFSYNADYLIKEAREAEEILMGCIKTKLKEKSRTKLSDSFAFFYNEAILDKMFEKGNQYNPNLNLICAELNALINKGKI